MKNLQQGEYISIQQGSQQLRLNIDGGPGIRAEKDEFYRQVSAQLEELDYYVILIKTFVEQMPPEVEESAMIDGAGPMNIFIRIILPLSLPIAATIAIYSSVHHRNSWFDNQLYTVTNEKLTTLQFLLYSYLNKTEAMLEAIERGDVSESSVMMTPAA